MSKKMLQNLQAQDGAISEITEREATGDRSVTLDRFEKSVLFAHYSLGKFARKGGARPNGNPDRHKLLVNSHNSLTGAAVRDVNIVHPKKTGNELRLYEAGSGLDLRPFDWFYIFQRKGDPFPTIGTLDAKTKASLQGSSKTSTVAAHKSVSIDHDGEDAEYQQAIGDTAAKLPVKFSGQRYPRDPAVAISAIQKAKFICEAAPTGVQHETFTSASTGKPFVEAHHLMPLAQQSQYETNLDVEANIVALCPNCHRRLHHASMEERVEVLLDLFAKRRESLEALGFDISEDDLLDAYGVSTASVIKLLNLK